jgi:hypothetical protein
MRMVDPLDMMSFGVVHYGNHPSVIGFDGYGSEGTVAQVRAFVLEPPTEARSSGS